MLETLHMCTRKPGCGVPVHVLDDLINDMCTVNVTIDGQGIPQSSDAIITRWNEVAAQLGSLLHTAGGI
jgi:hypothetical protein